MTEPDTEALPQTETADPELIALPIPHRRGRSLTLAVLGLTGCLSLGFMLSLRTELAYALSSGQPTNIGNLEPFRPGREHLNSWIRGAGTLGTPGLNYKKPLDPDRFRVVPILGNPKLWVEIREPGDSDPAYFVPPASFVGRLTRVADPGFLHRDLSEALLSRGSDGPPPDAWLLIDAESPRSSRWLLGFVALLLGFTGFSIFGLWRLAGSSQVQSLRVAKS
jgi:hypothetical protein